MSKNTAIKAPGLYKCRGVQQIAEYAYAMVAAPQPNTRARYLSHILLLLSDLDKATLEGAASADRALALVELVQEQAGLLRLVEESGIAVLSTDAETPLSLGGSE